MAKIPNGWRRIVWKDGQGKKWSGVVPRDMLPDVSARIINSGGQILKR